MNNKKKTIVQCKYIGRWKETTEWGKWQTWHIYREREDAEKAVENLSRKYTNMYEFRIQPDEGEAK